MSFQIEDGTGNSYRGKINKNNELLTSADSRSRQNIISSREGGSYQVIGDFTSINNSTHTVLHIKNSSAVKNLIVTYIRLQTIDLSGGTAPPSATNYWQIGINTTISSGGSAVTPVNVNVSSGNTADGVFTDNNPTMSGTFTEIDRYYIESESSLQKYNKEGSLILGKDDTLDIRITASSTSGTAYARVSFYYDDED